MRSPVCTNRLLRQAGFTLIELMIAVAIVAILARLAMGVYKQYVIRGNRADAEQSLLLAAQNGERWYVTNNGNYTGYVLTPTTNSNSTYTISVITANTTTLVLKATPVASSVNKNDGFLQISNTGVKGWDRNNDGTVSSTENTWTP